MRSLIIIEVEHGETTDPLDKVINYIQSIPTYYEVEVKDYSVKVDLPPCSDSRKALAFTLPSEGSSLYPLGGRLV